MRRQGQGVVRTAWIVACAVVALAVSGCTGEPEPARTRDPVVSPTASPSPQPTRPPRPELPEQPAAMSEGTADGAVAAATYYLELDRFAFATGDAGPLRAMSADSCVYCNEVIAEVERALAEGMLTERDPYEVLASSAVEVSDGEWFNAELRVRQGEIRVLGDDGSVLMREPGGAEFRVLLALSRVDERWTVDAGTVEVAET